MKKMRHTIPIFLVTMFLLSGNAIAEKGETPPPKFRLANVFNSKMVMQCDKEITVWGWGKPGESVTVNLSEDAKLIVPYQDEEAKKAPAPSTEYKAIPTYIEIKAKKFPVQTVTTNVAENGTWELKLKAMPAGFKPKYLLAKSGDAAIVLEDILVGEVWLCTGQSNMVMTAYFLKELDGPRDYPAIRYFREDKTWYRPAADLARQAKWSPVNKKSGITAIGFLFARYIQNHLKVPVGIMDVSRGGTTGDAWCSREALDSVKAPIIQDALKKYDAETALWETEESRQSIFKKWEAEVATKKSEHEAKVAKAKKEGKKPPGFRPPRKPGDPREGWSPPAGKFNISVYPIRKLPIRGVLFYQGENNCFGGWKKYEHTFPRVIESFHAAYGDEELPFGIIGLPGWGTQPTDEENVMCSSNVLIRDIHTRTHNKMKGTGLVETYDLGDGYIHPGDKRPVAERAARWALYSVYNQGLRHRGPKFSRMEKDGSNTYLYFDIDPHFLVASREMIEKHKPYWAVLPMPKPGGKAKIRGFVIAGKDRRWYPAETALDMKRVALRVWSPFVSEPVAVRYAWGSGAEYANATCNYDLPVPSFRTDDWPLPTPEELAANRVIAKYYAADRKVREALTSLPKNEMAAARATQSLKKGSQYKQLLLYKQAALESIVADMKKGWLANNIRSKSPELAKQVVELEKLNEAIKKEIVKIEE